MTGPARPRPKSKTPAERAEEFTAKQRQMKQDAADRREAREAKPPAPPAKRPPSKRA